MEKIQRILAPLDKSSVGQYLKVEKNKNKNQNRVRNMVSNYGIKKRITSLRLLRKELFTTPNFCRPKVF